MDIFKTMVAFEGEDTIVTVDTIEYQGKMWLVPEWLDLETGEWTVPARIVLLGSLLPHPKDSPGGEWDFVLNRPISRAVFRGQIPPGQEEKYVVIERPNIRIGRTDRRH
jgi:hypothetical protein